MIDDTLTDPRALVAPTVQTLSSTDSRQDELLQFAAVMNEAIQNDGKPEEVQNINSLSQRLLREFSQAESDRKLTEERWLKCLRQYRGVYDPEVEKDLEGHSKAFVRKTRVKVKTVDSRVIDLLFPNGSEKNWSIDTTPVPTVDDKTRTQVAQSLLQQNNGQQPTRDQIDQGVLALARESAKRMEKVIEDQLAECRYKEACIKAAHSGHLYGTGILKGPLVEKRVRTRFVNQNGRWVAQSEEYVLPFVDQVSIWSWFPDMAATELDQCRFVYERHIMTKAQLLDLARRKSFAAKAEDIRLYAKAHPEGQQIVKHYDIELQQMGERQSTHMLDRGQYEVLERWGWIDADDLKAAGIVVPPDREHETFFSNIWMLPNGEVIKVALQPIDGVTWPYHIYYFDKDETSIFGEGVPDIMRDDQNNLNAAVRMMLDNGALTSGPMVEIFLDLLATTDGQPEIGPWKKFYRSSGENADKAAIRPIELPNNIEWLSKMAEMFEANTDETTAIPRYMTGENASSGAAGTAQGMSMLMGAANIVIKDLINSWDEGITRTFLQSLYRWNMKFHPDNAIKGDFDVKARGTASLVAKEVRAQRLNEFAQMAANPLDAPYIKRLELLRERAAALEMGDIIKTDDEVKAEQSTEAAQQQQQMAQQVQVAQVQEATARAAKMMAEAELTKRKVDEMLANIQATIAKTVETRVDTIFAALQAGGVATRDPVIAPAGDEILKSAGFKDLTPNPSIAQLDGPPVQQQPGSQVLLNKGQTIAPDPRVPQASASPDGDGNPVPPSSNGDTRPEPANAQQAAQPGAARPDAPTSAQAGANAGMHTDAVTA